MDTSDHDLRTLAVPGAHIDYNDSGGAGDPILLVHGGVFGAGFAPVAADPSLAGSRVIRMIRAGYASGPSPTGHVSIVDHAAHCAALLDSLGIARADVVGHSAGAIVVMQLALDRPDLVAGLVLVEPPLIDPLVDPEDLDLLHAHFGPVIGGVLGAAQHGDLDGAFTQFMTAVCGPAHREVLEAALGPDGLATAVQESAYCWADEIPAIMGWQFDGQAAARIRGPVLLVQGGASPPATHRLVAHLAALLPDAEIATIDGDDHLLPVRSPSALGCQVVDFTRRSRAAASA